MNTKQKIMWLISLLISIATFYLIDDFRISFLFSGISIGIPLTTLLNNKSAIKKEDKETEWQTQSQRK